MDDLDLLRALLRGLASAAAVAALLWAVQRCSRGMAGLLAGLPTVTGPAMVWLVLDRGPDLAVQAAHGAVLAALPCGLFAWAYAVVAARHGRLASLAAASVLTALPLPVLLGHPWPMAICLLLAAASSLVCVRLMRRTVQPAARRVVPGTSRRAAGWTVAAAGAVSTLCAWLAPVLDPLWLGALTSPPLLAAAVACELHRQGCHVRVQEFLRGYAAGLLGRSVFVAVLAWLLLSQGLVAALCGATAAAMALGWLAHWWMHRRKPLAMMRPSPP